MRILTIYIYSIHFMAYNFTIFEFLTFQRITSHMILHFLSRLLLILLFLFAVTELVFRTSFLLAPADMTSAFI